MCEKLFALLLPGAAIGAVLSLAVLARGSVAVQSDNRAVAASGSIYSPGAMNEPARYQQSFAPSPFRSDFNRSAGGSLGFPVLQSDCASQADQTSSLANSVDGSLNVSLSGLASATGHFAGTSVSGESKAQSLFEIVFTTDGPRDYQLDLQLSCQSDGDSSARRMSRVTLSGADGAIADQAISLSATSVALSGLLDAGSYTLRVSADADVIGAVQGGGSLLNRAQYVGTFAVSPVPEPASVASSLSVSFLLFVWRVQRRGG
jgi:hypothetical protein